MYNVDRDNRDKYCILNTNPKIRYIYLFIYVYLMPLLRRMQTRSVTASIYAMSSKCIYNNEIDKPLPRASLLVK